MQISLDIRIVHLNRNIERRETETERCQELRARCTRTGWCSSCLVVMSDTQKGVIKLCQANVKLGGQTGIHSNFAGRTLSERFPVWMHGDTCCIPHCYAQ
jgi:hypothetical protein